VYIAARFLPQLPGSGLTGTHPLRPFDWRSGERLEVIDFGLGPSHRAITKAND
jgi:hypothetical protein